jgi:hypothetical protein
MNNLKKFVDTNRADMLADLRGIIERSKMEMRAYPKDYIEPGCENPSIDIRLCIDLENHYGWIFRLGSSDYDPYHSEYCGGSSIQLDTVAEDLLGDLLSQLE